MSPLNVDQVNKLIQKQTDIIKGPELCLRPKVSVSIATYNHEKYFRTAIESALSQATNFEFEIVVGEDCSSDRTLRFAQAYQQQHPGRVWVLRSKTRLGQYTNSGRYNHIRNMLACRGDYIAHLEGDDFWTCPNKLQQQADYLDSTQKTAGCFHRSETVDSTGRKMEDFFKRKYKKKYTQEECLTRLYSGYATCSLMFRRKCIEDGLPDYYYGAGSDYLLDIAITENGTLDYLPIDGAAYRIHKAGIWQGNLPSQNCRVVLDRILMLTKSKQIGRRYKNQLKERLDYHLDEYIEALRIDFPNVWRRIFTASLANLDLGVREKISLIRRLIFWGESNRRSAA